MSKVAKMNILKVVAAIGEKSARVGCYSASILGYHQPKEPAKLADSFKRKSK